MRAAGLGLNSLSLRPILRVVQAALSVRAAHMLFMAVRSLVLDLVSTHIDTFAQRKQSVRQL